MLRYLIVKKNGERVEARAPHPASIRRALGDEKILFIRRLKDDDDIQNLSEKRRYYNGTSRQSRSPTAKIRGGGGGEN